MLIFADNSILFQASSHILSGMLTFVHLTCVSSEKIWPLVRTGIDDEVALDDWETKGFMREPPVGSVRLIFPKVGDMLYMPPRRYLFAHAPITLSTTPFRLDS